MLFLWKFSWDTLQFWRYLFYKKKIESHVENFISTDIEWIPLNKVSSEGENKDDIKKLIELLDDDDDVQRVYSNFGEED